MATILRRAGLRTAFLAKRLETLQRNVATVLKRCAVNYGGGAVVLSRELCLTCVATRKEKWAVAVYGRTLGS